MAGGNFGGGTGTLEDPYLIEDVADFNAIRNNLSGNYKLKNDIDFTGVTDYVPIGDDVFATRFKGTLNGDQKYIRNLTITSDLFNVGIFGGISSLDSGRASVMRLYIDNVHVISTNAEANSLVGILTGCIFNTSSSYTKLNLDGIYVSNSSVNGVEHTGGLIGMARSAYSSYYTIGIGNTHLKNVSVTSTNGRAGGFSGRQEVYVSYKYCSFDGNVEGRMMTGGFVGDATVMASLEDCVVDGTVRSNGDVAGGFLGYAVASSYTAYGACSATRCISKGDVYGFSGVSGFFAGISGSRVSNGIIANCFALNKSLNRIPGHTGTFYGAYFSAGPDGDGIRSGTNYRANDITTNGFTPGANNIEELAVGRPSLYKENNYSYARNLLFPYQAVFRRTKGSDSLVVLAISQKPFKLMINPKGDFDHALYSERNVAWHSYRFENYELGVHYHSNYNNGLYAGEILESNHDILNYDEEVGGVLFRSTGFSYSFDYPDFDFESVWHIDEGISPPRLIHRVGGIDHGKALTHNMRYQRVVPHVDGTMRFAKITWKSLGHFFMFPNPPAVGVRNQVVTYELPESDYVQTVFDKNTNENVELHWFASGVTDINGAGGFGTYEANPRRNVVVNNTHGAQVLFYFTEAKYLPTVNYKLSVSTPDGIFDALINSSTSGYYMRVSIGDGYSLGISLVAPDSPYALPIRIATPDNGVMALREWVEFKEIVMEED